MCKNLVQPEATDDNVIRHMRFPCQITKATDMHLEYVILIAFPQQQLLCECASTLYIHTPACYFLFLFV
jgi:hypothetical protein